MLGKVIQTGKQILQSILGQALKLQSAFEAVGAAAIGLGVATIIVALMAYIVTNIGNQLPANSGAQLAISNGTKAINTFAGWLPLIAVVFIAALIIGIILITLTRRTEAQ
jgi:amino acid transporter